MAVTTVLILRMNHILRGKYILDRHWQRRWWWFTAMVTLKNLLLMYSDVSSYFSEACQWEKNINKTKIKTFFQDLKICIYFFAMVLKLVSNIEFLHGFLSLLTILALWQLHYIFNLSLIHFYLKRSIKLSILFSSLYNNKSVLFVTLVPTAFLHSYVCICLILFT